MIFPRTSRPEQLSLNNHPIEQMSQFCYLGYYFQSISHGKITLLSVAISLAAVCCFSRFPGVSMSLQQFKPLGLKCCSSFHIVQLFGLLEQIALLIDLQTFFFGKLLEFFVVPHLWFSSWNWVWEQWMAKLGNWLFNSFFQDCSLCSSFLLACRLLVYPQSTGDSTINRFLSGVFEYVLCCELFYPSIFS